jgi:type IV secretory pathway VirB10-like protein
MASVTKTGKNFVIVTRANVGTTTGTFANKTVTISGKGIDSGADFGTTLTVKAGTRGRNPIGAVIDENGNVFYKKITPPPTEEEKAAELKRKLEAEMRKKEVEAALREAEAAADAAEKARQARQAQQETASGENRAATAAQQAAAKAQQAADVAKAQQAAKKAQDLAAKLADKKIADDEAGGQDAMDI